MNVARSKPAKPSPYQIAAFTHAARARSFSKAAAALGVTQSSVTQHVARLEGVMGTLLFVRRRDGLELTRAGRDLFEVSDRLTTLEQLVEERCASYRDLAGGHLRIIATAPRPAMPMIERYARSHPQVQIEFSLYNWTISMAMVREREVDIALFTEPDSADGLYIREIGRTRYLAYVRRDHPLAERSEVSLRELAGEPVILPEDGSFTQRVVNRHMSELGLSFLRILKTTTFPVVKEAVLHGIGVGLFLEDSLYPSSNLVAIPVTEMPESYRNCVVTPADKRDLRLVRSFIDVAVETTG
jgi:LysR family transcriptional regulator, low CO2-responsive transcriptional regulator